MTAVSATVCLLSLAVCLWVYFGYPLLLVVYSRLRPRPVRRATIEPRVSIIVAARNEEAVVADKIANCLALDYPADKLEVLIGSNASTDRTEEIVRESEKRSSQVRLVTVERPGKAFALNACVERANGEILVFTDANTLLDSDSLRHLAAPFADPEVGAVTGQKKPEASRSSDSTAEGEGVYWRYEQLQKRLESEIGSCYAADGSLHAIRRALYVPISDPGQADDIAISARAVLQGYRLVLEPGAVVRERESSRHQSELKRKIRVTNRSVRAVMGLGRDLWSSGFYSVELLSHKLLRHLIPFFLITLFLSSLYLSWHFAWARWGLLLQLFFYSLALLGSLLRDSSWGRRKPFWIPYYFCFVNLAALLGVVALVRGKHLVNWTPRSG